MIHPDALNSMQTVLCLGIAYNCLERSAKTNAHTVTAISLSFVTLGLASVLLAAWPWWSHLQGLLECSGNDIATPIHLIFEGTVLAVQTATRTHWANGVPMRYQRRVADRVSKTLHTRRSTDHMVEVVPSGISQ